MRFADLLLNPEGRQVVAPRSMSARQFVSYTRYRLGKTSRFFIHIPKNAGSSIRKNKTLRKDVVFADPRFLKDQAYWQSFYDYMTQIGAHYGPHHARLVDWSKDVRDTHEGFAVVRNPWARVVSRYTYHFKSRGHLNEDAAPSRKGLEAFLETRHEFMDRPFFWHRAIHNWYPQIDYVLDENRKLAATCLRSEHLGQDLTSYLGAHDIRSVNKSTKAGFDWKELYTPKTLQLIADIYAQDIEFFGFDFDTPAQKNILQNMPKDQS